MDKRMKRNGWNLETMNSFCVTNDGFEGYKVLDTKWVKKSYQTQLWALIKCPNENHEPYLVCWNNFKKGWLCKQCFYENKEKVQWTKEMAYDYFDECGCKIININDWKNVDKTVWCYDKIGFKVKPSISSLKAGYKPSPFVKNKFALENMKLYCKLFRPDYDIISDTYSIIKAEYQWIYKGELPDDVNPIFNITADGFIHGGGGHPYLSRSNGNIIFERELILHNVEYIMEKTFPDCRDKGLLKFDFYLPNIDEIVEIDGEQHEKIIDFFGGEAGYLDRVKKDNIKNEYCEEKKIKMTRIPYRTNKTIEFKGLVDVAINNILRSINNK